MTTNPLSILAKEAVDGFKTIENIASSLDEVTTHTLSELYLAARDTADELEDKYKAATSPINKKLQEAQKTVKDARAHAKDLLSGLRMSLDACYRAEAAAIEATKQEALTTGNHDLLADLPEAPPVADGLTFSESRKPVIMDLDAIPNEYIIRTVDTKKLAEALKNGVSVKGAKLEVERTWKRKGPAK
jgi:hypothetical protein